MVSPTGMKDFYMLVGTALQEGGVTNRIRDLP